MSGPSRWRRTSTTRGPWCVGLHRHIELLLSLQGTHPSVISFSKGTVDNYIFIGTYTSPGRVARINTATFAVDANTTTTVAGKEIYWRTMLVQPANTTAAQLWLL